MNRWWTSWARLVTHFGATGYPSPSENGLQALRNLSSRGDPFDPSKLGHYLRGLDLNRPEILQLLAIAAIFLGLVLSRDLIREFARRVSNLIIGLPSQETLIYLELIFPAEITRSEFATRQLYTLLQDTPQNLTWLERIANRPKCYSLELVATKPDGLRYILVVPESESTSLRNGLLAYMPGLRVAETRDYLPFWGRKLAQMVDLVLTGDYLLPLKGQGSQKIHDPIDYIAGQMINLNPDEMIAYQIVVAPISGLTHPRITRRSDELRARMARGEAITPVLSGPTRVPGVLLALSWLLSLTVGLLIRLVSAALLGPQEASSVERGDIAGGQSLPKYEQAVSDMVEGKLNDVLFEASIRLMVITSSKSASKKRLSSLVSVFRLFTSAWQSIVPSRTVRRLSEGRFAQSAFARRVLPVRSAENGTILGSVELADLYHFPDTSQAHSANFVKTRSYELPMPASFREAGSDTDAMYGVNRHAGVTVPIRIPQVQRSRHTYIFGRTGTGKSSLMTRAIFEDIERGEGVGVLDPHGDMFRKLIGMIPESRRHDVVVFNPGDREFPIGINLLRPGVRFRDDIEAKDRITSSVVSVFQKLSGNYWGPRMEHILRNATLTALSLPNPTLFTLQSLLTDRKYQKKAAELIDDPILKQFWVQEMGQAGNYQLVSFMAPITSRLGQFLASGMSRQILLQQDSTISIEQIMDSGKILLVNLSKGELGEDQSAFFGTIITSLIWLAAEARAAQQEDDRQPFYVYVDEFQNFATDNFAEIVSEGRKFATYLTLAHQSVSQIEDRRILEVIAGNAGTIISFAGSPRDESFLQPFMSPMVKPGDIAGLAPHHFYIKAKDIPEADAFSGMTFGNNWLEDSYSSGRAAQVLRDSRYKYALPRELLEKFWAQEFAEMNEWSSVFWRHRQLAQTYRAKRARKRHKDEGKKAESLTREILSRPRVNSAANSSSK